MDLRTQRWNEVREGDALPPLDVPLTTSLVVLGALASRDFMPVHHDRDAAVAAGSKDVFMNILTTNGLVGRYVTDWAGPNAVLKKVAIRLGAPNFPGDTMKMTGVVKSKEDATGVVDLEVMGSNSWGNHVTAKVQVALPREA